MQPSLLRFKAQYSEKCKICFAVDLMSFPNLTYENIQEKGVYIKLYFLFVLS